MRIAPAVTEGDAKRIPIVYVLGYGRSGSTLFDIVLRNHQEVIGCGELVHLSGRFIRDLNRCGCRREPECPFWSPLLDEWRSTMTLSLESYERISRRYDSLMGVFYAWSDIFLGRREAKAYRDDTAKLFDLIAERSGKRVIVDSSKGVGRAIVLANLPNIRPFFVHLIRDPRGIAWSLWRDENKAAIGATMRWVYRNVTADLFTRLSRTPAMRVRYEDFTSDPSPALTALGRAIGLDFSEIKNRIVLEEPLVVGCSVDGNKIRKGNEVMFSPDRASWREKLPKRSKMAVKAVSYFLMRRYGYGGDET